MRKNLCTFFSAYTLIILPWGGRNILSKLQCAAKKIDPFRATVYSNQLIRAYQKQIRRAKKKLNIPEMTDAFSSLHLSACNYRWSPLPPTSSVRKWSLCTLCTAPQMVWVHLSKQLSVNSVPVASKSNVSQLWSSCLMAKAMDTQWKIPEPDHRTKLHSTALHSSPAPDLNLLKHPVDRESHISLKTLGRCAPLHHFLVSRDLLDNLVPCHIHFYSSFLPVQFIFFQQCII